MQLRQDVLKMIEQFSDEQLARLMPLMILALRENQPIEQFPSEASTAYQAWVGEENDVYDEIFVDELAAR
jgi:cytoplasmic iron level regulating protein YaaA (DUF328/UPF0246 family)